MASPRHHGPMLPMRRALLAAGMALPFGATRAAPAGRAGSERILVILELSGGNDGLNTVVPYGDDAYYRLRPHIGIRPQHVRRIDDHFGFNPGMAGFERLYKDGQLAIVHGCGYEQPSFSHFASMAYWHTAAPNSGEEYGWLGRLADALQPGGDAGFVVNIASSQSLAVRSRGHVPVVFDDPERFVAAGTVRGARPARARHAAGRRTQSDAPLPARHRAQRARHVGAACARPGPATARRSTTGW